MLAALSLALIQQRPVATDFLPAIDFVHRLGFDSPKGGKYGVASYRGIAVGGAPFESKDIGWSFVDKHGKGKFISSSGEKFPLVKFLESRDLKNDIQGAFANEWFSVPFGFVRISNSKEGVDLRWIPTTDRFLSLAYEAGEQDAVKDALKRRLNTGPLFVGVVKPILFEKLKRAMDAHSAGFDQESAELTKWLLDHREAAETEGKNSYKDRGVPQGPPVFEFLDYATILNRDSLRRLKEKKADFDLKSLEGLSVEEQVARLIECLQDVNALLPTFPGHATEHPFIKKLVEIGGPSVDPLTRCMESDDRLTRTPSINSHAGLADEIMPVRKLARTIFEMILGFRNLPDDAKPSDLRTYWERTKSFSPIERQFDVLTDDTAFNRWNDAATYLFGKAGEPSTGNPKDAKFIAGPLRTRANPSLADLLAKRGAQLCERGYGFSLLLNLEAWDPDAFPTAGRKAFASFAKNATRGQYADGPNMARFVDAMVRRGDRGILEDYAKWLDSIQNFDPSFENALWFYPLVRYADEPAFRDLPTKLFATKDGRFKLSAMQEQMPGWNHVEGFLASPLLRLPAFREIALEILGKRTVIGEVYVENGRVFRKVGNSTNGGDGDPKELKDLEGTRTTFRLCDALAATLLRSSGEQFQLAWPEPKRDAALRGLAAEIKSGKFRGPDTWYGGFQPDKGEVKR